MDADKTSRIVVAIMLSAVGMAMLMTGPIFLAATQAALGLSQQQQAVLPLVELAGATLASLTAVVWSQRVDWRLAARVAIVVVIAGNVLTAQLSGFASLAVVRFVVGLLGEGVAFTLGVAMLSTTSNPDRNFGFNIAVQVALGMAAFRFLTPLVEPFGIGGVMYPVAAISFVVLLFTGWVSGGATGDASDQAGATSDHPDNSLALIAVGVMVIWCVGLSAVYFYMPQIGVAGGLELVDAGKALSISTGLAIIGALAAAAIGDKWGRLVPVTSALVVQAVAIWLLQGDLSFVRFAAVASVFQIFWNMTGPFLMGTIAISDRTGKVAVLIPAAQLAGFALGPAVAAPFLTGESLVPANVVGVICCVLAILIFVPVAIRLKAQSA